MSAYNWFREWDKRYTFSKNYIAIDLETSGPDTSKDLIVQLGWTKVIDQKIVENDGILINWQRSKFTDTNWLRERLVETASIMLKKRDLHYPFTYESLQDGENPIIALSKFLDILTDARNSGLMILAHNGITFDLPILTNHFQRFLKIDYHFHPSEIFDTGAMEKASQVNELLCPDEESGDFAYRLILRSNDYGVRWNLHEFCVPKYNLSEKFNLDMNKCHTAPFDSFVTALLFEEYRKLSAI